ncbi:hypothetical protein LP316_07980 [Thalassotalea sp. LPB0316]|uniref:hypothetical protein n=1 Tax=Thalassotalea sp. LPB0316 TaxID=2769490 RepID=UPI001867622F|nr:hypothetical protein [Thalassotalea sp. LPB0316]QOL24325.1 hypothetical protein LP316_07980 [Thalassotalea sp. LPB0316]
MKFFRLVILLSLLTLLSASSFLLAPYLQSALTSDDNQTSDAEKTNQALVALGVKHRQIIALELARDHQAVGTNQWLSLSQQLARQTPSHALELADYYLDNHDVTSAMLWLKPQLAQKSPK